MALGGEFVSIRSDMVPHLRLPQKDYALMTCSPVDFVSVQTGRVAGRSSDQVPVPRVRR